jgi:3-oxosteroid 1-dehydrogenase
MKSHRYLVTAHSIGALAEKIGLPPSALRDSVARFNLAAGNGVDEEFGRGSSNYDQYWADPGRRPNPSLGTIDQSPFYAVRLFAGDIGTNGGVMTNASAQVVHTSGGIIHGLYAAGNTSGSPFAGSYPGAGATISAAATFGYIAARHAAGCNKVQDAGGPRHCPLDRARQAE